LLRVIQAIGLTSDPRKGLPPAVDDVSFEARAGRVTALLGASGAGKTTALRLMLELQQGRGITYFRGRPLHQIAHPSREVGVLLGDVPGHPGRTVRGHLRMLCAAAGVSVRRADDVLEAVGLVSLRDERLGTLSRGMDRRLGLACALLADPHTLVLDHPADGLSTRESRWLYDTLRAYAAQGGTVLVTTTDPKEAAGNADRVVTLDKGRLVADQEAADFSRTRLRPRVAVRTPHAARLAALLTKEARTARRSVEVVCESGNHLSVYGSTCANIGETAFRYGILVHQLADELGDMGPGAQVGVMSGSPVDKVSRAASEGRAGTVGAHETGREAQLVPDREFEPGVKRRASVPVPQGSAGEPRPAGAPTPDDRPSSHAGNSLRWPGVFAVGGRLSPHADGSHSPTTASPPGDASLTHAPGLRQADDTPAVGDARAPGAAQGPQQPTVLEAPSTDRRSAHELREPHPAHAAHSPANADGKAQADSSSTRARGAARPHPPMATHTHPSETPALDALDALSSLPPPISVHPAPSPLRPLRYELRRAAGIGTGFVTGAVVLAVSALTAVLLARVGHTPQPRLLAAWPRELPLPPAALGAGLLGALAFGDEFRHPALAADRGTVPRRLGLLVAKLLVAGATALLLAFLTVGCDVEVLYLVYGRELAQVPADWLSLSASWLGLVVGCAWAGVLAAGIFRSTTAGLAAVVAVPLLVVPLVHKAWAGPSVRTAAGFPLRLREVFLSQWPFGGERYLSAAAQVVAQPVGGALTLSLTALLCAYLLTTLRSRVR
jgi:ABC-type multidrug transport system ATPase subunit